MKCKHKKKHTTRKLSYNKANAHLLAHLQFTQANTQSKNCKRANKFSTKKRKNADQHCDCYILRNIFYDNFVLRPLGTSTIVHYDCVLRNIYIDCWVGKKTNIMENKHKALLNKWYEERPEYDTKGEFCWDGPSNWGKWTKQVPKILFLVKEPHSGYHPSTPSMENPKISGKFCLNIARWKFAIRKLYENSNEIPAFPNVEDLRSWSENKIDDIAIVEVKKMNEEKKSSSNQEIIEYAKKDKEFLKEQIDLINPNIILCGNTFESYKTIYDNDAKMAEQLNYLWLDNAEIDAYVCSHRKRMIISFYHPSYRKSTEDLFELLCRVIKEGNVFDKFDWSKKSF